MYKTYSYFLIFVFSSLAFSQSKSKAIIDSIEIYKEYSRNKDKYTNNQRLFFAEHARQLSLDLGVDSITVHTNRRLSTVYSEVEDYDAFERINRENIYLSTKIGDSSSLAKANFKLGLFYKHYKFKVDSAYYYYGIAKRLYKTLDDNYSLALVLYEIAVIQNNEKDLVGSELTSIEVLALLESLNETESVKKHKSFVYNNLGLVFCNLKQYDESISYYKKALALKETLREGYKNTIDNSKNNLALSYERSGKYQLALDYYEQILDNENLVNERPSFFALVLGNYAHTLYLSGNKEQLPQLYLRALEVCNIINESYKRININIDLAEYYNNQNKKDSALYYAYQAKDISEKFYKDDLLKSLLLLSQIETDSIAVKHYAAYVALNDSLQHQERITRNKFARIQFETEQHIEKNKELTTQNFLISILGGILVLVLGLLYFVKLQRTKNRQLVFDGEQQKTNEEIYMLMLEQKTKLEEARLQERHRIAEDLHDGILSQLFGTRIGLGFLELEGDKTTLKDYKKFLKEMQKIEKEIRDVSHELKSDILQSQTNFESIIEHYLSHQSHIGNFKYEIINKDILFKRVSDTIKVNIYRIIQEAMQNIIKHAKAKNVLISFSLEADTLHLKIEDDGVGFDDKLSKKGIGLKNIKSRVLKLNGIFRVNSVSLKSTILHIAIPL